MPTLGVNVVILQDEKILVTKREDIEVWCLPGGGVDPGESIAQAAVREVREETGLEVELERLVGIYSRPRWREGGDHDIIFTGIPVGGHLKPQPEEVIEIAWVSPQKLPEPFFWWDLQRIADAIDGKGSVAWLQDSVWPLAQKSTPKDLYKMRDESSLPRQEIYLKYLAEPGPLGERLEVGPKGKESNDDTR